MGYHTDFEGQFLVSRPVSKEIAGFLKTIQADAKAIGVFADWLEEQQDERQKRVRKCKRHEQVHAIFHALSEEHAAYLRKFCDTRRMRRDPDKAAQMPDPIREAVGLPIGKEGGYFVGGLGHAGQDHDPSVLDGNKPPKGQAGLWCHWTPNEDGTVIEWDQGEKFYYYVEWIEYILKHFVKPWGYQLDGKVKWKGEETGDRGVIHIKANDVEIKGRYQYD